MYSRHSENLYPTIAKFRIYFEKKPSDLTSYEIYYIIKHMPATQTESHTKRQYVSLN